MAIIQPFRRQKRKNSCEREKNEAKRNETAIFFVPLYPLTHAGPPCKRRSG